MSQIIEICPKVYYHHIEDIVMKKKDILNLIRYHAENDEEGFKKQAELIASEFYQDGDEELALYIKNLISPISTIIPQGADEKPRIGFLEKVEYVNEPYIIPDKLKEELIGIVNASKKNIGLNKYIFYGEPGTGKTQAAYQISRLLKRNLWQVNISQLIDSLLGKTSKNINQLFQDINEYPFKKTMIVLFDEIDSLALNRNDSRDLREMSRATTELFKGLDSLSKEVILIATTNLFQLLDKALIRRFVAKIDFDVYEKQDLIDVGMYYYKFYCDKVGMANTYGKIVNKLLLACPKLPNPGELRNIFLTSLAFSNDENPNEHIQRLFREFFEDNILANNVSWLQETIGLTTREIELVTGISKSEVSRRLQK